jgi:hypothetical protein
MAMAQRLEPAGEEELALGEFVSTGFAGSDECPTVLATGEAGAACLRHPLLVHAAQPHHGTRTRFVAQLPGYPAQPSVLD